MGDRRQRALGWVRLAGHVEGVTLLLLLLVGVPLKHLIGWPAGVRVLGPVHGVAFIAYLAAVIEAAAAGELRGRLLWQTTLCCIVPFGPFLNDRALARRARALSPP